MKSGQVVIPIYHDAANIFVRVEKKESDVVISPVLGEGWLCEPCWLARRVATCNPQELHPEAESGAELVAAFENTQAHAGRPESPVQRAVTAKLLRSRVHSARNTNHANKIFQLSRVKQNGEVQVETVLPLPGCDKCWCADSLSTATHLETVIGHTAGVVAELQEIPARDHEPDYPYVVISRLSNSLLQPARPPWQGASGKGDSLESAIASTVGESVERYAAESVPPSLLTARVGDLQNSIDPCAITGLEAEQAIAAGYGTEQKIAWTQATSVADKQDRKWLPASSVYLKATPAMGEHIVTPMTSNGLAAAPALTEAIQRAYAEVIERHLFFLVWYGAKEADEADAQAYIDKEISRQFESTGLQLTASVLGHENPAGYVASASCWPTACDTDRPGFTLGLGTGRTVGQAVGSAVLEVAQVYRGLTWALHNQNLRQRMDYLRQHPLELADTYDHALLYATRSPEEVPAPFGLAAPRHGTKFRGGDSMGHAYFVDITPRDIAQATGWSVARVVAPGRIPLHIGSKTIPYALLSLPDNAAGLAEWLHPLS